MSDLFKTDLMSLVAYLRYAGFTPMDCYYDLESDRCTWMFSPSGRLREAISAFRADEVRVRPREYSRAFAQVKRDMYDARIRSGADTWR